MKNLFGYVTCKILPYGICIVLSSCIQNNKQRVVHAVEAMLGRHIIMPNDMCQFSQKGDSVVYMNSSQDHIFIYFSSDYCPECNVWRIQEWRNIESQFDRVQFVYTQVSVVLHGSACGFKIIRKLNKKIIKRLRHLGSSYNFLNKFLYNFERSDLEANGIKSLRNLNSLIME